MAILIKNGQALQLSNGKYLRAIADRGQIVFNSRPGTTISVGSDSYTLGAQETQHIFANLDYGMYTCKAEKTGQITAITEVALAVNSYTLNLKPGLLPMGYTQLQYLEGTGTQWIQLEPAIISTQTTVQFAEIDFRITTAPTASYIGVMGINSAPQLGWANNGWHCGNSNDGTTQPQPAIDTDYTYRWEANGGVYKIDGNTLTIARGNALTTALYKSNGGPCPSRVYEIRLMDTSNVVLYRYLPAVRESDSVYGFYETYHDQFYINNGTGIFIPGPEA